MFGSKKAGRAGEIDVSDLDFLDRSSEFARCWSEPAGEQTFIIEPRALGADPFLFGMAMVDAIRHAAIAYSRAVNVSEEQALARIMEGFHAELENPTDAPNPLPDEGSLN
jgi:hypothetical protein